VFDIDFTEGGHYGVYEFCVRMKSGLMMPLSNQSVAIYFCISSTSEIVWPSAGPTARPTPNPAAYNTAFANHPDELHNALVVEDWT
jgi:hypothetical protein